MTFTFEAVQDLMNKGFIIVEEQGKFLVKKITASEIMMGLSSFEEAIEFINKPTNAEEIECALSMCYDLKGYPKLINFPNIKAKSEKEAYETAKQIVESWFKKEGIEEKPNFELKIRPI